MTISRTPTKSKAKVRVNNYQHTISIKDSRRLPFPEPPPLYSQNESTTKANKKDVTVIDPSSYMKSKSRSSLGLPRLSTSSKNNYSFVPIPNNESGFSSPPISPYRSSSSKLMMPSPAPSLMSFTSSSTETLDPYFGDQEPTFSLSPAARAFVFVPPNYTATCQPTSRYSSRASTPTSFHTAKTSTSTGTSPHKSPTKKGKAPEDLNRKQRMKTELCWHYKEGRICPYGASCTYAHGEEQLQMTRLMDKQRAGLIEDAETYRTKPCWTWVATGSCPFGIRCAGIHDPRVTGSEPFWLTHTETQGNSLPTDINVDGLHQKRTQAILYGNPFGDHFSLELDDFTDLYKLVCNTTVSSKRRRNNISEIHKLSIALQMRGDAGWMYKYRPQHVICGTLCMILQKRAFRLEKSGNATPIAIGKFKADNPRHVLVRELAFGPDSDPTVRGVALYFDISEKDVGKHTPQQAKKYRHKRNSDASARISILDTRECFTMIRPYDRDAFSLATQILQHRLETVTAERLNIVSERYKAIKTLNREKECLKETFQAHKRNWIDWCWPVANGRHAIDDDTPVPPVNTEYTPIVDQDASIATLDEAEPETVSRSYVQPLWESFVDQTPTVVKGKESDKDYFEQQYIDNRRRLSIFTRLGYGEPINTNRALPHITKGSSSKESAKSSPSGSRKSKKLEATAVSRERQSERCWRALLLKQEKQHTSNEWNIVKEHFLNSRGNKRSEDVLY